MCLYAALSNIPTVARRGTSEIHVWTRTRAVDARHTHDDLEGTLQVREGRPLSEIIEIGDLAV